MQKRFKPLLAVAVAAGVIPILESATEVHAAAITAGAWNFDSQTGTTNTQGSVSFSADSFSPGYGGSLTATLTNTTGTGWTLVSGNGSAKALNGSSWLTSGQYNFGFDIDDLNTMVIRFDMRSSNTGPGQFVVQDSLDGSVFSNISTITVGTTAFNSTASVTAVGFTVAFPAGFSDTVTGVAGQTAIIRLLGLTTPGAGSATIANAGVNAIDNILITGQQVPEPTAMVMTLAAAAGLSLRPKRRGD